MTVRARPPGRHARGALLAATLLAAAGAIACATPAADAAQRVRLGAAFRPNQLGAPTTIEFRFRVSSHAGVPAPVTEVDLFLPAGMGLATSTLGLAECQPATLQALGPEGCPANARVGMGSALGEVAVGGKVITERATVYALLGPPVGENEQVLFYVAGNEPVLAELVFPGQLLSGSLGRFGARLDTAVPIVPAWTDGPDIAVTSFSSTLGPQGLTYYRRTHGRLVAFHPKGIAVPRRCPRGGFPFAADFAFADSSHARAHAAVPCPQ